MWRYFLNYYQSWEGWYPDAPIEKRQAYICKNMTNIPMWAGSIVHDEIEEIIKEIRASGECRDLSSAQHNSIQALRRGWIQSKNKKWENSPKKNINLAEHYYDEEVSQDRLDETKAKILLCLKAFYDSDIFRIMHEVPKDDWLSLEEFQKFSLKTGEEVSVKIDCGFRYKGKILLFDWKTGKVNSSVIDQLVTYAMYAIKVGWTSTPDNIVIVPVYLAFYHKDPNNAIPKLSVSMNKIKSQTKVIQEESKLLAKAHENRNNPEFFTHTDDPESCKRCHFRGICSGADTEIDKGVTPF